MAAELHGQQEAAPDGSSRYIVFLLALRAHAIIASRVAKGPYIDGYDGILVLNTRIYNKKTELLLWMD